MKRSCLEIALPREVAQYVIFKGSIAIDGISLTVAKLQETRSTVWLIPHTVAVTNLQQRSAGEQVNLEFDLLAKYLERLVAVRQSAEGTLGACLGSNQARCRPGSFQSPTDFFKTEGEYWWRYPFGQFRNGNTK